MIKTTNKRHSAIKVRPKKSTKSKSSKASSQDETDQFIKDKYFLQIYETNIQSLKNQAIKLQDKIFKLKKENSLKENQIRGQKQFLLDKEKKINKRRIAIFPHSNDYQKFLLENEKAKKQNANLAQEVSRMQQLLAKHYDELEEINNKSNFNSKDTFEVQQLERYNVEMLQSKIVAMSKNCSCSQQKIDEYKKMMIAYDEEEKEIQKSIDDTADVLCQLNDRKTELKAISDIENFEMKNQLFYVEYLESEVKEIEELISSNDFFQDEVDKAQNDYENFISEINEKKQNIFQKRKNTLLQQQAQLVVPDPIIYNRKIESKIDERFQFSEEDLNGYKTIIEKIYDQLSNRGDVIKTQNIRIQTKQVKNGTNKSKIEGNLKTKIRKIDFLKSKYQSILKKKEEILFQINKVSNLKEKSLRINELLSRALNREKNAQNAINSNEEDLLKLNEKKKQIEQKEECLFNQEENLKEKNVQLIQKEKNIKLLEQQIQIREKNIKQMEQEAHMLKDKLASQMKLFENELLITPFHEKIGLTA